MSAITRKKQQACHPSIADDGNKPAIRSPEDCAEQNIASNVPSRKNSKSNTIQKQSSSVVRQVVAIKKLEQGIAEWSLKKRKILFFYQLTFISLCWIIGAIVIFGASSGLLKAGALAFLWGTARAFRKHITSTL